MNGTTDEFMNEFTATPSSTLINDRTRGLSSEHRLANPSQMSIASRTSIRYSTPRESTVFTKTDAPPVVRLLQQTQHHDTADAIKTIIEHQRLQQTQPYHEHLQTPIIVEEDISPPSILSSSGTSIKSPAGKKSSNGLTKSNVIAPATDTINQANGHLNPVSTSTVSTSQPSVFSTLKYSLIKHQQQQKPNMENSSNLEDAQKHQHTSDKHRVCCTII